MQPRRHSIANPLVRGTPDRVVRPEYVRQAALYVLEGHAVPARYLPALAWWALYGLRVAAGESAA